jgi:hypothetical protein
MPATTPVGQTFVDTISCGPIGPQSAQTAVTTVTITATSPDFYASPGSEDLVQGTCLGENFSLLWTNPGQGYCGSAFYDITTPLPPGITAAVSGGQLDVCADSDTPAPLGAFTIGVTSDGCAGGGLYTAFATVNVVPPPPCRPRTCEPNSCQGTIPDGCGGVVDCPSSCDPQHQCKTGLPGQPAICCAPTQILNNLGECACPNGSTWNPSAGPAGECQAVCPSGQVLCDATGTCLTVAQCRVAGNNSGCPKNARPGTCS